ncbi:hypothetical protein SAMN05216167_1503 [Spirosoma endophyticum]|uniref:Tetratricopeptide repeat-containing protein n=1 Tax=Spirosoma endophyticum TaxID=662367 RepID=A0A1I2HWU5_9BACT|nr:hypothetical protein SAMN05216167_1503 [Spirosoma endophyticum]
MNLFTLMRAACKVSPASQPTQGLPLQLIKFHLSEAHRLFGLEEYSQALFHCEEALLQDPANAEASRMHRFIRQEWQDYINVTPDSLFSFLWRPKAASIPSRSKSRFGVFLRRFFKCLTSISRVKLRIIN